LLESMVRGIHGVEPSFVAIIGWVPEKSHSEY
jgi:hypothetical protein